MGSVALAVRCPVQQTLRERSIGIEHPHAQFCSPCYLPEEHERKPTAGNAGEADGSPTGR